MRSLTRILFILFLMGAVARSAHAEPPGTESNDWTGLLEGKDSFSLLKPPQWTVNVDDAKSRGLYAYFVLNGYTYDNSPGLMYIRVMDKMGLSIQDHLNADVENYRKSKPPVKFKSYKIPKLKYRYAAKKYIFAKTSCDYVCYLDPGKDEEAYLIFVLTADSKHCDSYRDVFISMLETFDWGGNKTGQPR